MHESQAALCVLLAREGIIVRHIQGALANFVQSSALECVCAGVGLYYGEDIHGVPPVLLQMVSRTPVLYEVNIFVTNRFVPIPEVLPSERILVEQLGVSGFYHIVAR